MGLPEAAEIRHLLARTGFGTPAPADLEAHVGLSYTAAVDKLLDGVTGRAISAPPGWIGTTPSDRLANLSTAEKTARQKTQRQNGRNLKGWWYGEMLNTPSPFTERMVLFWHNHFTSSLKKVKFPDFLFDQNVLFRTYALGNFADLLRAVSTDPAMMVYLDTANSKGSAPNENFARELMELFTLGEGQGYTEDDIREAARAFTGWRATPGHGFEFTARAHDSGAKTFFERRGRFGSDDIIKILLEQPRVAEHITEKLWRSFVSASPDPADVKLLAAIFRESGYEMRPLMRAMLMTAKFRDESNRGTLVKSPTDLVVGTYRLVAFNPPDATGTAMQGRGLGQDVFDPPNVKGWPGGAAWINTAALPARYEFLREVSDAIDKIMGAVPPGGNRVQRIARMSREMFGEGLDAESAVRLLDMPEDQIAELLLPIPRATAPGATGAENAIGDLLLDPVYQLK